MTKIGDHVDTIHGKATIIFGRRVAIHGTGGKTYPIEKGTIKSLLKTREQLREEDSQRFQNNWKRISKMK